MSDVITGPGVYATRADGLVHILRRHSNDMSWYGRIEGDPWTLFWYASGKLCSFNATDPHDLTHRIGDLPERPTMPDRPLLDRLEDAHYEGASKKEMRKLCGEAAHELVRVRDGVQEIVGLAESRDDLNVAKHIARGILEDQDV